MSVEAAGSYPMPEDPALADAARSLNDAGHWAYIVDDRWRVVHVTDDLRLSFGGSVELSSMAIGEHLFSPAAVELSRHWLFGTNTPELMRGWFGAVGGLVLTDTSGGRDELRSLVDPVLRDIVDDLEPVDREVLSFTTPGVALYSTFDVHNVAFRIRDASGRLAGTALLGKPAASMDTLAAMAFQSDLGHLERMRRVAKASRRPSAILFADLEGSSLLARRLSTASYFALGRRLVRAADRCVIDAGGLVGRHVGDGFVAFFPAETSGSESAAARACITAARALRDTVSDVAVRSGLDPEDVVLRFGLHWGSTLYMGRITTGGRSEVTALGDEANEAARIEASATGGRALASKDLIERLDPDDAAALAIDPDHVIYTRLTDLDTATEKAHRDAPAIPVCDV